MTEEQRKELQQLKMDYNQTFGSEAGQRVLKDLSKRCFKNDTTFDPSNSQAILVNEGARQVLLTIENMRDLNLDIPNEEEE